MTGRQGFIAEQTAQPRPGCVGELQLQAAGLAMAIRMQGEGFRHQVCPINLTTIGNSKITKVSGKMNMINGMISFTGACMAVFSAR